MGFSLFACCHIVPNLSSVSVFPDFLFLSQPTHIHPLYSVWIHHSHFRKANDPFWLPKLPASAAAWIPKITKAWNNCSLHLQKMSPDPSEQWKISGERQTQLLQPFKIWDSKWAVARWGTHTPPSNSTPSSPFPQSPFILCSGCPPYPQRISQTWQNPTVLSPDTSFCPWGHSSVTHMCTRNSSSCITTIFWTLFSRHRFPNHHKHQARHCKGSTAQMPADCFFPFFFCLLERALA